MRCQTVRASEMSNSEGELDVIQRGRVRCQTVRASEMSNSEGE